MIFNHLLNMFIIIVPAILIYIGYIYYRTKKHNYIDNFLETTIALTTNDYFFSVLINNLENMNINSTLIMQPQPTIYSKYRIEKCGREYLLKNIKAPEQPLYIYLESNTDYCIINYNKKGYVQVTSNNKIKLVNKNMATKFMINKIRLSIPTLDTNFMYEPSLLYKDDSMNAGYDIINDLSLDDMSNGSDDIVSLDGLDLDDMNNTKYAQF